MIVTRSSLISAAWLGLLASIPSPAASQETATQAPLQVPSVAPVWTAEERTAIDLLRSLRSKERPSDDVLARRLAVPGKTPLALLFQVLATRSIPAYDGGAPQKLSEIQENVILLALAQQERDPVLSHVGAELARTRELGPRAAAVGFLGAVGRANDLPALLELALMPEETALDQGLQAGLRRAVASILGRDARAFDQLVELRRITRPELFETLITAVGDARDGRGLAFLADLSYWHEDLALEVMAQVCKVGLSGEETVDDGMRNRLRPYLDAAQPAACRAALLALTELRDFESITSLIELLSCETAGIRDGALWSLRQMTGLKLASSESWATWHQHEQVWLLREKAHEFRRLRSNDAAEAADALRTILTHPLTRDELVSALPDLLKNRWPAIRILACRSLAELSAKDSVEKLVWALEDPTSDVAQAAYEALRVLTKLDLPRDPAAWQATTQSRTSPAEL